MKNLFKFTMVLAAGALMLSSCNCFKKMAKNEADVKVTCAPEVLALNNGKIAADIAVTFPAKYFNKKAVLKVTPVIAFGDRMIESAPVYLQGEKVDNNYKVVSAANGGNYTHHVEFAYDQRMQKCELQLLVEIKCPKGKCKEFTLINANTGAMPTDAEKETLAKGGKDATSLKHSFGMTIAKGLNTLQKDLDYASAMQAEANGYKNVTNVVTKADIAYKINSAKVEKNATKTDAIANVKNVTEQNKSNDRVAQSLYVNGYASPDGPEKFNDDLSSKRSQSGLDAVKKILADAGINIDAASYGEDWEGFQSAVMASDIQDKEVILNILKMYSSAAERETEIKNLSSVYSSLKSDILPQLRRAQVVNSADITGKTDAEMAEAVAAGKCDQLDVEELLHIAEVNPACAKPALEYAAAQYKDARAYNNLGIVYAGEGNYDKAAEAFENSVKAGNKSAEINNNLALAYLAQGNTDKAASYTKAANAQTKALADAAKGDYAAASQQLSGYNAAIAQIQSGNLTAAKKSIINDNSAKADYLRAVIANKEGNLSTAKSQLASAISKDATLADKAKNDVNLEALYK